MDYPGTSLKTTWPRFALEGIRIYLVLWKGTCPCWLSTTHGDPGSTQILTRHCGAKSHTDSQLTNLGPMPTRQVPIIQPLWVFETPVDGVGDHVALPFDNPDGTGGFISHQRKSKLYIWNLTSA
jgi:hypothetical protein